MPSAGLPHRWCPVIELRPGAVGLGAVEGRPVQRCMALLRSAKPCQPCICSTGRPSQQRERADLHDIVHDLRRDAWQVPDPGQTLLQGVAWGRLAARQHSRPGALLQVPCGWCTPGISGRPVQARPGVLLVGRHSPGSTGAARPPLWAPSGVCSAARRWSRILATTAWVQSAATSSLRFSAALLAMTTMATSQPGSSPASLALQKSTCPCARHSNERAADLQPTSEQAWQTCAVLEPARLKKTSSRLCRPEGIAAAQPLSLSGSNMSKAMGQVMGRNSRNVCATPSQLPGAASTAAGPGSQAHQHHIIHDPAVVPAILQGPCEEGRPAESPMGLCTAKGPAPELRGRRFEAGWASGPHLLGPQPALRGAHAWPGCLLTASALEERKCLRGDLAKHALQAMAARPRPAGDMVTHWEGLLGTANLPGPQ